MITQNGPAYSPMLSSYKRALFSTVSVRPIKTYPMLTSYQVACRMKLECSLLRCRYPFARQQHAHGVEKSYLHVVKGIGRTSKRILPETEVSPSLGLKRKLHSRRYIVDCNT
jgi:hypothetical protein